MPSRSIAKHAWSTELAGFSEQHEGWLVSIRRYSPDGETVVEAHDVPLEGISSTSHGGSDIAVEVGRDESHLTHRIHDAIAMRIELTADHAARALVVDARDGSTTSIEFRSPTRAEEVDGRPMSQAR